VVRHRAAKGLSPATHAFLTATLSTIGRRIPTAISLLAISERHFDRTWEARSLQSRHCAAVAAGEIDYRNPSLPNVFVGIRARVGARGAVSTSNPRGLVQCARGYPGILAVVYVSHTLSGDYSSYILYLYAFLPHRRSTRSIALLSLIVCLRLERGRTS
jgi:hypothetical protein